MLNRIDPFADFFRFTPVRVPDAPRHFRPAVDVRETDAAFVVATDLPGVSADDIAVDVEKDVLVIRAQRATESDAAEPGAGEGYRVRERFRGTYERRFTLPETVDADAIEAQLADGVLTLTLPKREAPSARRIAINAA